MQGYYEATKNAVNFTYDWEALLQEVSSVATDGASINTGCKAGLWVFLDDDKKKIESPLPFLKIWCSVHRSALAWGEFTNGKYAVREIKTVLDICVSLTGYFHKSGLRTKAIKMTAEELKKKFYSFPTYHEVRWTEFTYNLLLSVVKNYVVLIKYFEDSIKIEKDNEAEGYLNFFKTKDKILMLCFLTDLAYSYARFQKGIQGDEVLIFDIEDKARDYLVTLGELETKPLLGGWEERFYEDLNSEDDETYTFHGITLIKNKTKRRKIHHLYVSEFRSFDSVRSESCLVLKNFFTNRLDMPFTKDVKILQTLNNSVTDDEIKLCHKVICPDFDLLNFASSYREAAACDQLKGKKITEKNVLKSILKVDHWRPLAVAMARIIAATPHSADVERLISYYNILKTSDRSSLSPATIKNQLYIKINMPTLSEFDPQPAINYWVNLKERHPKPHTKAVYQPYFKNVFAESEIQSNYKNEGYAKTVGF